MSDGAISGVFKSEHGITALYIAIIAAALGEILPDPSDALYFYWDRKWRVQLEKGEITVDQYWNRREAAYYLLDFFWWMLILAVAILVKGDIRKKALVVGAIVGGGAVIGIIAKNKQQDKEFFKQYKLVKQ